MPAYIGDTRAKCAANGDTAALGASEGSSTLRIKHIKASVSLISAQRVTADERAWFSDRGGGSRFINFLPSMPPPVTNILRGPLPARPNDECRVASRLTDCLDTDIDLDADTDEEKPNVLTIRGSLLAALTLTATVFLGAPATHADVDYDEATEQSIAAGVINFRCKDKGIHDVIVVPLDNNPENTEPVVVDDDGKPVKDAKGSVIEVDLVGANQADLKDYEKDGTGTKERTQAWYSRQVDIERSFMPYVLEGGGSAEDSTRQNLYHDNKYNPTTRREICGDLKRYSKMVAGIVSVRKGNMKDCCVTEQGLANFLKDKMRAFSENDKKEALGVYKKEGSPLVKASE